MVSLFTKLFVVIIKSNKNVTFLLKYYLTIINKMINYYSIFKKVLCNYWRRALWINGLHLRKLQKKDNEKKYYSTYLYR